MGAPARLNSALVVGVVAVEEAITFGDDVSELDHSGLEAIKSPAILRRMCRRARN